MKRSPEGHYIIDVDAVTQFYAKRTGKPVEQVKQEIIAKLRSYSEPAEHSQPPSEVPQERPDRLLRDADLGQLAQIANFPTAEFYSRKLDIPAEEVDRLYREERDRFYQLLDEAGLRVTVRAEDL